jgi:hypothetical protein
VLLGFELAEMTVKNPKTDSWLTKMENQDQTKKQKHFIDGVGPAGDDCNSKTQLNPKNAVTFPMRKKRQGLPCKWASVVPYKIPVLSTVRYRPAHRNFVIICPAQRLASGR